MNNFQRLEEMKKQIYAMSNKKVSANELFNMLVYESMRNLIYKISIEKVSNCKEVEKITESEVLIKETELLNIYFTKNNHERMKTYLEILKIHLLTDEKSNLLINKCIDECVKNMKSDFGIGE